MKKIWQKSKVSLLPEIERFTVADDYLIDMHLVKQDIMGSIAHSRMLKKIEILTADEQKTLENGLKEIYKEFLNEDFEILYEDEDVHTKVEKILTDRYGAVAKKLHTARSRNDQVLTDMRLFNKEQLLDTATQISSSIQDFLNFAKKYQNYPLCGYTHMQKAMPSSIGQWALAFVEQLTDLLYIWQGVFDFNDSCPLGSGAGFGVSLDIDREQTAKELGFARVQINPIYCQNSRGIIEGQIIDFLCSVALTCNKIATDLMTFTTGEFAFFKMEDCITTGSSIMPQKKNLDVCELIRGRTAHLIGNTASMKSLISNLISGYHRDLQDTKKMIISSFDLTKDFLKMLSLVFANITPIEENLINAFDKTVFATDYAYEKVIKEKVPFREAYQEVGKNLDKLPEYDVKENILSKTHLGSTGNLGIERVETKLEDHLKLIEQKAQTFKKAESALLNS